MNSVSLSRVKSKKRVNITEDGEIIERKAKYRLYRMLSFELVSPIKFWSRGQREWNKFFFSTQEFLLSKW
jgi:hypothetical protein